jgi:hypothetical protein
MFVLLCWPSKNRPNRTFEVIWKEKEKLSEPAFGEFFSFPNYGKEFRLDFFQALIFGFVFIKEKEQRSRGENNFLSNPLKSIQLTTKVMPNF